MQSSTSYIELSASSDTNCEQKDHLSVAYALGGLYYYIMQSDYKIARNFIIAMVFSVVVLISPHAVKAAVLYSQPSDSVVVTTISSGGTATYVSPVFHISNNGEIGGVIWKLDDGGTFSGGVRIELYDATDALECRGTAGVDANGFAQYYGTNGIGGQALSHSSGKNTYSVSVSPNNGAGCVINTSHDYQILVNAFGSGSFDIYGDTTNGIPAVEILDTAGFTPINTSTHIVSFTPPDGFVATTTEATTTVDFNIHIYISPNDIGNFLTVKIQYKNIDQNTILNAPCTSIDIAGTCSPYTFDIFKDTATSSGDFYYASTTVLKRGNYRVEASLSTATQLFGLNLGFFTFLGAQNETQDHQFIVGSSTFIGNISQNLYKDLNSFFNTLPATTTEAMAASCNPIGGSFDVRSCFAFLLIPDAGQLSDAMTNLRKGVFQKMPFGYVTRVVDLLATTSTSSLPILSYTFQSDSPLAGDAITFDVSGYMTQAAVISSQMTSNTDHKTVWQIFETPVKLFIYLVLIFAMMRDVTGLPLINHKK